MHLPSVPNWMHVLCFTLSLLFSNTHFCKTANTTHRFTLSSRQHHVWWHRKKVTFSLSVLFCSGFFCFFNTNVFLPSTARLLFEECWNILREKINNFSPLFVLIACYVRNTHLYFTHLDICVHVCFCKLLPCSRKNQKAQVFFILLSVRSRCFVC